MVRKSSGSRDEIEKMMETSIAIHDSRVETQGTQEIMNVSLSKPFFSTVSSSIEYNMK